MTVTIGRRELLAALGSAVAAWPLAARAQQVERTRRIGVLTYIPADDAEGQARLAAFTQALSQLGWSEGRNLQIDARWANAGDIQRHAAESVAAAPDVSFGGHDAVHITIEVVSIWTLQHHSCKHRVGAGRAGNALAGGGTATLLRTGRRRISMPAGLRPPLFLEVLGCLLPTSFA